MKFSLLFLINIFLIVAFSNCKERETVKDPCYDELPSSADYVIEQKIGDRWFISDTVISGQFNTVRFTAKQNAKSYLWRIGTETITTRSFEKTWLSENTLIPVSLIVNKSPNKICFPFDDGIDTVVKNLYVWPATYGLGQANTPTDSTKNPYLPIYGTYYGESLFEPGLKKFVTIIDTVWTDASNRAKRVGLIRGIPYNSLTTKHQRNSTLFDYVDDVGVTALHLNMKTNIGGINGFPTIPKMKGYAWLEREDWSTITIEYEFLDTVSNNWISDTFKGKRAW